jgi:hypothetical protein
MGYLMVLHVSLGAKFGDLHAKDSHSFCNKQMRSVKVKETISIARRALDVHTVSHGGSFTYR